MHPPSWSDDQARLIAEAAPLVPTPTEADVDRVWNRVAEVVATPEPARRRRRTTMVGAGVAALVLGSSGIAAAAVWSARTGEVQTSAESIRLSGPGELIDPRGADFEQVLLEEIDDIPFPSADARDIAVADQVQDARREATDMEKARASGRPDWRSVMVTGGMRAEAARQAVCAWANTWSATTSAGDSQGRSRAIGMLEASRTWPAIIDVDAEQTITPRTHLVTDGETGETTEQSYLDNTPYGFLPLVVKAAQGHDKKAMGRPFVEWSRCIPELMPDLPDAVHPEFRVK